MNQEQERDLTVVVPCYNEAARLEKFFLLIRRNLDLNWEWLFIDDGSCDETPQLLERFASEAEGRVVLHSLPWNRGKGHAVRQGFLLARGKLVGFVDADLSASPLQFDRYLEDPDVLAGTKMIIGMRLMTQDGSVERTFLRHFVGRCFQTYSSVLTGLKVYDTQCGFKLLSRDLACRLAGRMKTDGFAFDVELILLAHLMGVEIAEERIAWKEMGNSTIRPHHVLRMAYEIVRIRNRVHGSPPHVR